MKRSFAAFLLSLFAASVMFAQDDPPQTGAGGGGGGRGGGGGGAALGVPNPQPFDRVITKEAKSKKGMFTVHQVGERFFYEIPKSELGKEYLWNTQISKNTLGAGYGGSQITDKVVAWDLHNNRVYLRDVNYAINADPESPIAAAVKNANNDTIIMAFNVAAYHDGNPVIDVSRLYNTDVPEFSARQHIGATAFDATRSFIDHISPYPDNIESEVTATYTSAGAGRGAAGGGRGGGGLGGGAMRGTSATIVLHHSMVRLPEKPMMPRLFDERVGYFTTSQQDYTADEYRVRNVRYIARWRLEKKNPTAAMSDPVKPIIYYIDSSTPKKWAPWLKKGVEDWNEAFAAAGFTHAIIAKDAPTAQQDPDFSPEDVRNSVIRWLPSTTENASGPHISDPRTGEILNADIQFYHNVMNLARDWYFVQVGPLDPRAQKLPLPDELMGRLLEYVVCHEVGHTLGFQHNMKASAMYPADKIRDKDWVHKMGHTPSIMDYSRFNYVAQPEDGIAVEDLIPRIGPYDIWATKWGYSPIAGCFDTEGEEKPTLDKWAREQDNTPWYRFSTANSAGSDPGEETEAVGDADAVKSTAMGMKNLQRVSKMLMKATAWQDGETYEDLSEVYGRVLSQWQTEMNHVAQVVGGLNSQEKVVGQEGRVFTLVPKARQEEAAKFLVENALSTPVWLIDPEILRRIEANGALTRIRNAQNSVLNQLLNDQRFARLIEQQTIDGTAAYTAAELLATVRKGVWKELDGTTVKIDAYRRNLQNAYLELVNTKLNGATAAAAGAAAAGGRGGRGGAPAKSDDEKPFYRAELRVLNASITAAMAKATDHDTKAHLEGAKDQIAKILDPKFLPPAPAAAAAGGRGGIR